MAIYELEDRVFFDGAMPADIAEAQDDASAQNDDTYENISDESVNTENTENVSIAPDIADTDEDSDVESASSTEVAEQVETENSLSDIDIALDGIEDIEFPEGYEPDVNAILVSTDDPDYEEITGSVNDDTIIVEYGSADSIETIIQNLQNELGERKPVNIGLVNSGQLSVNSEQLTGELSELQTVDGQTDIIDLDADNSELALSEYFDTSSDFIKDSESSTTDIYFIDSGVGDADQIIAEIPENAIVIELGEGEGIDRITEIVNEYSDIDSVHIISQGNYAQIMLGNDVITDDNITEYQDAFSSWNDNLSENADILFYGCDIAKEAQGQAVIDQIAEWTGADIAASTDITGGDGGDWDLEHSTGLIEAATISVSAYNHHLETYTVTEITDNGAGTTEGSLSWAITQANSTISIDDDIVFNLSSGDTVTTSAELTTITDTVDIDGTNIATGNNITVQVETPGEGGSEFRVFKIDASDETVTISNMTIRGGDISGNGEVASGWGGGIYIAAGTVYLDSITVSGSKAYSGGGLYAKGSVVYIDASTFSGNTAYYYGGGIISDTWATMRITNSTIDSNKATERSSSGGSYGAGIHNYGDMIIVSSTISNNTCSDSGGGIRNLGTLTVVSSTISGNSADYGGGITNAYINSSYPGLLYLVNTNVINNTAISSGNDIYNKTGTVKAYYSWYNGASGTISATGCITTVYDSSLSDLADNGGYIYTMAVSDSSAALSAGCRVGTYGEGEDTVAVYSTDGITWTKVDGSGTVPAGSVTEVITDQRGYYRTVSSVTIGAYQYNGIVAKIGEDTEWTVDGIGTSVFTSVQAAVTGSTSGAVIVLADTSIKLTDAEISANGISVERSMTITGEGDDTALRVTVPGTTASRVFQINDSGTEVTISNITIKGGDISSLGTSGYGGGILVEAGTLILDTVTVSGAVAYDGGGIYNKDILTLTDSTISCNTASSYGGGIANVGTLTINTSTISRNTADNGGGIAGNAGSITINSSIINKNTADNGGGLYIYGSGTLTLTSSTVINNTADTDGGGAYFADNSNITVTSTTIANNTAASSGGGIYLASASLTIQNTILANNTAGSESNDYYSAGSGTLTDNGYNVVEYSNLAATAATGFNNITDILYNTGYDSDVTDNTSWTTGGEVLSNQTLGLSETLADNGGYMQTLAVDDDSFLTTEYGSATETTDQRGYYITSAKATRGAYQYNGIVAKIGENTSWTAADIGNTVFYTIQSAVDAASAGATIVLASTSILMASDEMSANGISITKSITIKGEVSNSTSTIVRVTEAGVTASRVFNISVSDGTVNISNMTIKGGDIYSSYGGSIFIATGIVNLNNVTVSESRAYLGGGVYNAGTLNVTSSTFSNNTAHDGAGIFNDSTGIATVISSTFSGNDVSTFGGGIFSRGTLTVTSSTFSENETVNSGGGIYNNGTLTVTSSTFNNNTATYAGAGIYNLFTTLTVTSSTFNNNTALYGSGILNEDGTLTVTSSTLINNTTTIGGEGGGIYNSGTAYLLNSIVINNTAENAGNDIYNRGTFNAYYSWYNGVWGTISGGTGCITAAYDGSLSTLADNGGYSYTMAVSDSSTALGNGCRVGAYDDSGTIKSAYYSGGNWIKLDGSGTIDSASVTEIATDQRGYYRTASSITIGAYQYNGIVAKIGEDTDWTGGTNVFTSVQSAVNANTSEATIVLADTSIISIPGSGILVEESMTIKGEGDNTVLRVKYPGITLGRVFKIDAEGKTVTIENMTINGGDFTSLPSENGGGILVNKGTLNLNTVTVSGSTAHMGGGIYNNSGTITLTNSTISDNTANSAGGGICNANGSITLINSIVNNNTARTDAGGILNAFATMTLINSTVSNNNAAGRGGGFYNYGTLIFTSSTINNNTAAESGGIFTFHTDSSLTLTDCTISDNSATDGNAGGIAINATANFYGINTFSGNTSTGNGDAIYLQADEWGNGTLYLNDSTLYMDENAAIYAYESSAFDAGTSTVIYNGSNQSIADLNYYNLTLSGNGTKTLNGDLGTSSENRINTFTVDASSDTVTVDTDGYNVYAESLVLASDGTITGTAVLNISTSSIIGSHITTTGTQTYGGTVTLTEDIILNGTTVTFNAIVDGAKSLEISGNAEFAGVVGGSTVLSSLSVSGTSSIGGNISTTGAQTYTGAAILTENIILSGSTVTFNSTVNGAKSLEISGNAEFAGIVGGSTVLSSLSVSGTSSIAGNITTTGAQTYTGAVTISNNTVLDAGNSSESNITLGAVTGSGHNLTVDAGEAGTVEISSAAGIGAFTVTNADTVNVIGALSADSLTITAVTTSVSIGGALTVTSLNLPEGDYSVSLTGGGSITNAVTFSNTGGVTIGDDASDSITFHGGVTSINSTTSIAGDIRADEANNVTLDTVYVTHDVLIGCAITLGNVTLNNGVSLTLGEGESGNITVTSISEADGADATGITVNTTGSFTVAEGIEMTSGYLNITVGTDSEFNGDVEIGGMLTKAGEGKLIASKASFITGGITVSAGELTCITDESVGYTVWKVNGDITISVGATLTAAGKIYVSGNWTREALSTFNNADGEVIFTGSGESVISGENIWYSLTCETGGKTLTFNATEHQVIQDWFTITGEYGTGKYVVINNLNSEVTYHAVYFAEVHNSENTNGTITASFSVDEGGNTNWEFREYYIWNGSQDNDWNNTNNWTGGHVPFASEDVLIDTQVHNLILNSDTIVQNFAINESKTVEFGSSVTLTTTESFISYGTLSSSDGIDITVVSVSENSFITAGTIISQGNITLQADEISLNQAITTSGGNQAFNGDIILQSASIILQSNGGDISTTGTVISSNGEYYSLTVNAGTGSVEINSFSDSEKIGNLEVGGSGGITFNGDVYTSGSQTFNNMVTLTKDIAFDSNNGDITFESGVSGTSNASESITVDAGTGKITFGGTLGSSDIYLNEITINSSTGGTEFNGAVYAGLLTIADGGAVDINAPVTLTGAFSSIGTTFDNAGGAITAAGITVNHTGAVNLNAALNSVSGAMSIDSAVSITLASNVTSDSGNITFGANKPGTVTVSGERTLSTGISGGNIKFNTSVSGSSVLDTLEVNAGTGTVSFESTLDTLGQFTLVQSGGSTFKGNVNVTEIVLSNTTGNISFTGSLTAETLTTAEQDYSISLVDGGTVTNAVTFSNTGGVTLTGNYTFTNGVTSTASTTTINGNITTADSAMTFGAVTLSGNTVLDAGTSVDSDITLGAVTGSGHDLTVDAGEAGAVEISSAAGLGTLTVTDADTLNVSGALSATTLTVTDITSSLSVGGELSLTTLTLPGTGGYSVFLTGSGTIGNEITFANTGGVTLNDITFSNGLTSTASVTTLTGNVTVNNNAAVFGTTLISDDSTVDTDGSAITFGSVTVNDSKTLTVGTGHTGAVTFNSTVEDAAGGDGSLVINTDATVSFEEAVGSSSSSFGSITVVQSGGVTFAQDVYTDALVLTDTDGTITFTNALSATSLTTTGEDYAVVMSGGGTVTNTATFSNTGGVTLTGDYTFTNGVTSTASTTTVNGNITTVDSAMSLGAVTLSGNAVLDTGTSADSDITLGAVTGSGHNLTVDAGASGAVEISSVTGIGTLTVTDAATVNVSGALSATELIVTDITTSLTVGGELTLTDLTLANTNYSVTLTGGGTVANAVTFSNTGGVTLKDITFENGVTSTASTTTLAGNVTTTNDSAAFGTTIVSSDSTVSTSGGAVTFGGTTVSDTKTLTVESGAGTITFDSVDDVSGETGNLTVNSTAAVNFNGLVGSFENSFGTLTVTQSGGVTFAQDVYTDALVLTDTDGTIKFTNALSATSLTTTGEDYAVVMSGGGTVTNAVTFSNTGGVTLNDITFSNGLTSTASVTTLTGNVTVNTNAAVFGTTIISDDSTVDTDGSAITFGSVTVNDSKTLTVGTGHTGAVTFNSTVEDAAGAGANLVINTDATVSFQEAVGSFSNSFGSITVVQSGDATFTDNVYAGSVTLQDTNGTITFTGALNSTSLTAEAGDYSVSLTGGGTVTNTATFSNTGGVVTLTGDYTFTNGVTSTALTTTVNGNITTVDKAMTFGAVTLSGNTVLDAGTSVDSDITLGAVTGGDYNLTVDSGELGAVEIASAAGIGTLTVTDAATVNVTGALSATELTVTDITSSLSVGGELSLTTLTLPGTGDYSVSFTGSGTIGNEITFANTGGVTLNDITFSNGLTSTASITTLTGNVTVNTNAAVFGTTIISDDSTVDTDGSAVTFGSVTVNDSKTLTVGTGHTGAVTFNSTVEDAAGGDGSLVINTDATVSFQEAVGSFSNSFGSITVVQSGGATFTDNVYVGSVTLQDTNGTITFTGALNSTSLTAEAGDYSVSLTGDGTVTNTATFSNTGGGLTLTGDYIFTNGVTSTASTTTVNGNITTVDSAMILGAVTLSGNTVLDAGTSADSDITLGAVTGGDHNLTVDSGELGAVEIASAAGIITLAVTDADTINVSGALSATTLTVTDITTSLTVGGELSLTNLTLANTNYSVTLTGGGTVTNAVTFSNTGGVTLKDITFDNGVTSTASTTTLAGNVTTTNDSATFGTTIVSGDSTVSTAGGSVTFGAVTVNDTKTLTVESGAGTITFDSVNDVSGETGNLTVNSTAAVSFNGVVGSSTNSFGTLTVTQSGGVTFAQDVYADTVALTDTDGTITFTGALTATSLTTTGEDYAVVMSGGGTITDAVTFSNSGGVTIGDDASDSITFHGGVTSVNSTTSIAGDIRADEANSVTLGTLHVTDDASIGCTITLGDVTLSDDVTLTLGIGEDADITVESISGTLNNEQSNLILNTTGTVSVTGNIGTDIGTITITQSGGVTFNGTVDAETLTITDTTGTVSFNDSLTLTSLNTAVQNYAVEILGGGEITNAVTFYNLAGVTIGDESADSTVFHGGVTSTASILSTSIAGTITVDSGNSLTLGTTDVTADTTLAGIISLGDVELSNGIIFTLGTGGSGNITVTSILEADGANATGIEVNTTGSLTVEEGIEMTSGYLNITVGTDSEFNGNVEIGGMLTKAGEGKLTAAEKSLITGGITVSAGELNGESDVSVEGTVWEANGDITISSGATLTAPGKIYVSGDWTREALSTFNNESGEVIFTGTGESVISGANTWYALSCETGGKTLTFNESEHQVIGDWLTITGEASSSGYITINNLNSEVTYYAVYFANVSNSSNTNSTIIASYSVDGGGNTNWVFKEYYIWDGYENNDWNNTENWTGGVIPGQADDVLINTQTNNLILNTNITVQNFAINEDKTIEFGSSVTLTATNAFMNNGTVGSGEGIDITIGGGGAFIAGTITSYGNINLQADEIGLNGTITTYGGDQAFDGDIILRSDAVILQSNGGDISTTGTVLSSNPGDYSLTANAGTGSVEFNSFSDSETIGNLEVTGSSGITLNGDVYTSGSQTFNDIVTLTGDTTFDAGNANITFGGGVSGTSNASESITLDAGTGKITFGGTLGSSDIYLEEITINSSTGGTEINGAVYSGLLTIADGGAVDINAPVTLTGAFSSIGTTFDNTGGAITAAGITVNHTGTVNLNAALNSGSGLMNIDSFVSITLAANVTSDSGNITFGANTGTVTVSGERTVSTGISGGNIKFNTSVSGSSVLDTLEVNAGTGTVSFESTLETLGQFTLAQSGGATFSADVNVTEIVLSNTNGNISFTGSLTAETLTTAEQGYSVLLNDGGTIANAVTFSNTGGVTLKDITFENGVTSTASTTTLSGNVTTTNDAATFGTTIVSGNATVDTAGGNIIFGALTLNDGVTLTVGTGDTGSISFGETLNSAVISTGSLTINTDDTVTFNGDIGNTLSLGTLTLVSGNVNTAGNNITAEALTINGGTFNSGSNSGTWNINDDVTIGTNGTLNSTSGNLNISGNWSNSGIYDHNNGTVIFDGNLAQSISGINTFYNLSVRNISDTEKVAASGTLAVANDMRITDGTFVSASDYHNISVSSGATFELSGDITVSGNWVNAGTFTAGTYSVTFDGIGIQEITSGGNSFYSMDIDNNLSLQDALTATGSVDIASGKTVTTSNDIICNITFEGSTSGSGTIEASAGTVTYSMEGNQSVFSGTYNNMSFSGSGTKSISGTTTANNNLTLNDSDVTVAVEDNTLTVSGNVDITSGNLTIGSGTLKLGGESNSLGTFTAGIGSTVEYNGTSAQTVLSETYYNLTVDNGSDNGKTLGGDITVNGNLTITSDAVLDTSENSYQINVAGNWNNSGTFNANSGIVVFDGSGTSEITGSTTFYDLTCTVAGKILALDVTDGALQTVSNWFTLAGEAGNHVELTSTEVGTQAELSLTYSDIKYTDISYANNSGYMAYAVNSTEKVAETTNGFYFAGDNEYIWIGKTDSDWDNASNWTNDDAPGDTSDVIIAHNPNSPELFGEISVKNFTVTSEETVIINGTLTASEDFVNNGTVISTADSISITAENITTGIIDTSSGDIVLNANTEITVTGNITSTNNDITLDGSVTIAENTTFTGENVIFTSTVDSETGEHNSMTINGNTDFNGEVGGTNSLDTISVSGTTEIEANITTENAQTYNGAVILTDDVELNSSEITFESTVDSETGEHNSITINGNTDFNGKVGGTNSLDTISVNGTTEIEANITTENSQTYNGAVILTNDVELNGTEITFESTVDSETGEYNNLTITGDAEFNGNVGSTDEIGELTVSGTSEIGADITTDGTQSYNDIVLIGTGDYTLTSNDHDITVYGNITDADNANGLAFDAGTGTTSLTAGKTATVGGALTKLGSGDLVTNGTDINAGSLIVSEGIFISGNDGGTWKIGGEVFIADGATLNATSDTMSVDGNWENSGTFNANTGTVSFTGTDEQQITSGGSEFNIFELNNANGAALADNMSIENKLVLTSGLLTLGTYRLTLNENATIGGTPSSSAMVVTNSTGTMRKKFNDTTGKFILPVGTNDGTAEYSPVTIEFTSATFASDAYVDVRAVNEKDPENTSTTNYLNRYWSVESSGITNPVMDITCQYVENDVEGSEADIYFGEKIDSSWKKYNAADIGNHSISGTGITTFGNFTGIEKALDPDPKKYNPVINDGTQTKTRTSWRNAIDDGAENEIDSDEGFEPNELEGLGLYLDSLITFDISSGPVANGEYSVGAGTGSGYDGEYGIGTDSGHFIVNGEYDVDFGFGFAAGSGEESGLNAGGIVDLSFDFDCDDSFIDFEAIAVYSDKHPLFKTELDLLLEKI